MIIVTYTERRFVDCFTCVDTEQTIKALSSFVQGGLTYFRINRFNYKVIETDLITSIKEGSETMNPNWADLFKANLVKPAWADNAKETEISFIVHSIDSCIGTNWRKDGNNDEQLFGNRNCSRPGHRKTCD